MRMGSSGGQTRNVLAKPYVIPDPSSVITDAQPFADTTGRVVVPSGLVPGERTLVLVFFGQSLSVNEVPTVRTITQAKNHQLNILDGLCYRTAEPMLGINVSGGTVTDPRGTWMSRLGDNLIAHGVTDRTVLVPAAVGGTTIAQQVDDAAPPYLGNKINTVAMRIRDAGLKPSAIFLGIGESDTSAGTTQAAYAANQAKFIAMCNREMPNTPILIARESYYYGAVSSAVLAAQDAAVNNTTVFAGENCELIPSSGRYDNTHLNEAGADQRATLAEAALRAALGI
jgi:hypothetical protein